MCDICKTPFAFKTVYDADTPDKVPFPVVLQRLIRKFIKFLIRGVIVFATALILTLEFPLFISAMFRVDNWLLGCNLPSAGVLDSMLFGTDDFDKVNRWSVKNLEIIVLNSYAAGWSILLTLGVIGLSLGVIHSGVVSDEGLVKIIHKRIGPEPRMNRIAQALNPNWVDNGNLGARRRIPRAGAPPVVDIPDLPDVPAAAAPDGGIDGQARVQQLQDRLLETERLARQLDEIEHLMQNNVDDNNHVPEVVNPPEEDNDMEQDAQDAPANVADMPNDDFDEHAERIRERMGILWDEVERAHLLREQEAIAQNDNVRLEQIRRERDLIRRFREEENGRHVAAAANPQNQQQQQQRMQLEEQQIEEQIQRLQQNQQRQQQPRVRQRDDGNFIEEELWKIVLAVHLATFLVLFVVYFMPSLLGMLWINIVNGCEPLQ
ncbi:unnamed protein product [Ambrosiozyma monospora]|uniref:Unnamed protein product n=1 Tax=Ambrosiozyma monospora TaxID=43982 RepID=A0ACB5T697_AMBMO|nr:unnamed protein product [Ambrosiozyma monospora]